jgi:hypothetical protein
VSGEQNIVYCNDLNLRSLASIAMHLNPSTNNKVGHFSQGDNRYCYTCFGDRMLRCKLIPIVQKYLSLYLALNIISALSPSVKSNWLNAKKMMFGTTQPRGLKRKNSRQFIWLAYLSSTLWRGNIPARLSTLHHEIGCTKANNPHLSLWAFRLLSHYHGNRYSSGTGPGAVVTRSYGGSLSPGL